MSGADETTTQIHTICIAAQLPLVEAVQAYQNTGKPWATDDLIGSLQRTAELHLASVAIANAAKTMADATRTALEAAMTETGCPAITIPGYRISTREGPQRVVVTDHGKVPHNLTFQPPAPPRDVDLPEIKRLLLSGYDVAGCELVTGKPSVSFTSRKA